MLSDFINLAQVHNFTVSAQDIFTFRRLSVFTVRFTRILQVQTKHMVKMYSLYKLFEFKFSGKTSEEKYAASLGTKAKQIFFNLCDYFKKYIKNTEIQLPISSIW